VLHQFQKDFGWAVAPQKLAFEPKLDFDWLLSAATVGPLCVSLHPIKKKWGCASAILRTYSQGIKIVASAQM
jgi:hypothetical protein